MISDGIKSFTWMEGHGAYKTEQQMLYGFLNYVKEMNVDVLTGYNTNVFDWPYIHRRCEILKINFNLSKLKECKNIFFKANRQSKAKGNRTVGFIYCPGMLFNDMLPYVLNLPDKQTGYTLKHIAPIILKDVTMTKEEFDFKESNGIFYGVDDDKKKKFLHYNMVDAHLCTLMSRKTMAIKNVLIEAKIVGMTATQLLTVGLQQQIHSLARRYFFPKGYIIPMNHDFINLPEIKTIEGAFVIEPVKQLYIKFISTFDVNSMYPSIMREHNLCVTTLDVDGRNGAICHPSGFWFIPESIQKGVFPEMLELLINERTEVRKKIKTETDEEIKNIMDITQNKLKVKANSIYGATGAKGGVFSCPYITATVTAIGRGILKKLQAFIESSGLKTIYGDTDSIFCISNGNTVAEAFEEGQLLKKQINNGLLGKLIKVDHEDVKYLMMLAKKKYVAISYKDGNDKGTLKQKGTIAVKTDNAPIARNLFKQLMNKVMIDRIDKDELESFVRLTLYNLLNRVDVTISDFIISKNLSKEINEYRDNPEHVAVVKHWMLWDPISAPIVGSKVPYIIVSLPSTKAKVSERCRPPFMVDNVKEIDIEFFIKNKLQKQLIGFLEVVGFTQNEIIDIFDFPYIIPRDREKWYKFGHGPLLLTDNVIDSSYLFVKNKKSKHI
jgi:DNA polymerase delta subunit 1